MISDTNFLIAVLNRSPEALRKVKFLDEFFVPVIAMGELVFGSWKSARREENLARLEELRKTWRTLEIDEGTA